MVVSSSHSVQIFFLTDTARNGIAATVIILGLNVIPTSAFIIDHIKPHIIMHSCTFTI